MRRAVAPLLALAWLFAPWPLAAASAPPSSFAGWADCGYLNYDHQHYRIAIRCFEKAWAFHPANPAIAAQIAAQIAYAERKIGDNRAARHWFEVARQVLPPEARRQYAREIEALNRPVRVSGYLIHQSSAISQSQLALAGSSLTQSQGAIEASWRPPGIGFRDGRIVELYGRLIAGLDGATAHFEGDSLQGGLGARWKPFKLANFWLAGERLIKLGNQSANAWMARASYSASTGYGVQGHTAHWPYATLYLDTALIRPDRPDLFTTAQGELGESFRLITGRLGTLVVTPHALALAVMEDNLGTKTTLLEAGPGIGLKLWIPDGAYGSYRSSLDLLVQYRKKLTGNSTGGSAFVVTAVMGF